MRNYLDLLQRILDSGTQQSNRTGVDTLFIPGAMMQFDLTMGFPIITTKKLAWRACRGEMLGHLRGARSAAEFRALGCGFWDANANAQGAGGNKWLSSPYRTGTDDLGRIYGVQWRSWRQISSLHVVGHIDQVAEALRLIRTDPTNRRIIINAWRPDEFAEMALPPCHVLYQFIVDVPHGVLNLCMYQRSCDMFLGVPMNISGAALMLALFAKATGMRAGMFTHFLADAHIYVNHIEQVREQLKREPLPLPTLDIHGAPGSAEEALAFVEQTVPDDIELVGYQHHEAIRAEMAV